MRRPCLYVNNDGKDRLRMYSLRYFDARKGLGTRVVMEMAIRY